jgi:hypothetical protein
MSNESNNNEPEIIPEPEPVKRSKLRRIKSAAATVGIFTIPSALVGGMMYFTYKISKMDLETAKINLEAAKLHDIADAATQQ